MKLNTEQNYYIAVTNDGVLVELQEFNNLEEANLTLLKLCSEYIHNWDEYIPEEKDIILEKGYERCGEFVISRYS